MNTNNTGPQIRKYLSGQLGLTAFVVLLLLVSLIIQQFMLERSTIEGLVFFRLFVALQGAVLGFLLPGFLRSAFTSSLTIRVVGALTAFVLFYAFSPSADYLTLSDSLTVAFAGLGGAVVAGLLALTASLTKYWISRDNQTLSVRLPDGERIEISHAKPEDLKKIIDTLHAIKDKSDGNETK